MSAIHTPFLIGIDLGTTNTVVCPVTYTRDGPRYNVRENFQGKHTTPSVVAYTDGRVLVGQPAIDQQPDNPENTVFGAKRLIGRKRSEEEVRSIFDKVQFDVARDADDNPLINVTVEGNIQPKRPEEISSSILGEVILMAKNWAGKKPDACVIGVPAFFNDLQRQSTILAAELAGLNVLRLVNEPTAAAIAFQHMFGQKDGTVLVFDFGGGTLDCSILEVKDQTFTVKAVSGNTALGGEDFDIAIMTEMVKRFKRKTGKDPTGNKRAMAQLKLSCEEAKVILSADNCITTQIIRASFFEGVDLVEDLTRSQFHVICDELFDKIIDPIEMVLDDSGLSKTEIDYVILVGGSSKIPYVKEKISTFFDNRIPPITPIDPATAVAIGAAIMCDKLQKNQVIHDLTDLKEAPPAGTIVVIDVQPVSIGILEGTNRFKPFILKNKYLPQSNQFTFATVKHNQPFANVIILQGEDEIYDKQKPSHVVLGDFKLTGLPLKRKGYVHITVRVEVDPKSILTVTATCVDNDAPQPITQSLTINVKKPLEGPEKEEAMKAAHAIMSVNDARYTYQRQLVDFKKAIVELNASGKDVSAWELMHRELQGSIPRDLNSLVEASNNILAEIQRVRSQIK